jgi:outer membrane protein OmpA-like peptidoglycan-associated protein
MKKTLMLTVALAACAFAQPGSWQTPGKFQTPGGHWQTPAEKWQVPGDIQVPQGIQMVKEKSRVRLSIGANTLFAYDKAQLSAEGVKVLGQLGPTLVKFGPRSAMTIEGHTDSKGSDDYNQKLSEARAASVRDWLKAHHYIPGTSVTVGYGEKHPAAPNTKPDGSDDPVGRQKNRRVEILIQEDR